MRAQRRRLPRADAGKIWPPLYAGRFFKIKRLLLQLMVRSLKIFTLALTIAFMSCNRLNPFGEEVVVAEAGDAKLYVSEVATVLTPGLSPQDSLKLVESYVDMWIKKQLKIQEAEKVFEGSGKEIEAMVADYRNSLLSNRLDQFYVDSRIDTLVTEADVERYYDQSRNEFILDRPIVKGVVVRLPAGHAHASRARDYMKEGEEGLPYLKDISQKNSFELTEFPSWCDFGDFLSALPTTNFREYDGLLAKNGVQEMKDGGNLYLVAITSSRKAGDVSPIERVAPVIRRVIYNQRRQDIIRAYEDSIYNAALRNGEIEIKID